MSVALVWVVFPNIKVLNCFGVLDSSTFAFGDGRAKMGRKQKWNSCCLSRSSSTEEAKCSSTFGLQSETKFLILSSLVVNPAGEIVLSSEQKVYDVVLKQAALVEKQLRTSGDDVDVKPDIVLPGNNKNLLSEAYDRCREVCAVYAKIFDLGTLLMTPERRRAIRAIDVWCRGTHELVDGPNASHIFPQALGRWESRLEDLFQGRPFDMLNAALQDTVTQFSVHIQLFKDMIEGMRMDLRKSTYKNFDKLYLYCYYTAGTVGLMSVPVMGIAPDLQATTESVYNASLALGIANQLTNILRDVGEELSSCKVFDINVNRRLGAIAALSLALLAKDSISTKLAYGFDFQLVAPDQTIEEAESGIIGHAQALLQVKQLIESESWGQLQTAVRKSSPLLKQDIYTIIQQKPGNERPLLRKLYSNLFNNVTRLDYAARDRDQSRIRECYENIVVIVNDLLSRL